MPCSHRRASHRRRSLSDPNPTRSSSASSASPLLPSATPSPPSSSTQATLILHAPPLPHRSQRKKAPGPARQTYLQVLRVRNQVVRARRCARRGDGHVPRRRYGRESGGVDERVGVGPRAGRVDDRDHAAEKALVRLWRWGRTGLPQCSRGEIMKQCRPTLPQASRRRTANMPADPPSNDLRSRPPPSSTSPARPSPPSQPQILHSLRSKKASTHAANNPPLPSLRLPPSLISPQQASEGLTSPAPPCFPPARP